MSKESDGFRKATQNALTNALCDRTPQCPDPETMLDWIECGQSYPQAPALLDHLLGCAYCRRERVALLEIRVLAPAASVSPKSTRQAKWLGDRVSELIETGFVAPARTMRTMLGTLDQLAAHQSLAVSRNAVSLIDLWPNATAVRTTQPTLCWSETEEVSGGMEGALSYSVTITRMSPWKKPYLVWNGNCGMETHLTLPEQGRLEPGGIYRWQVVRWAGDSETLSEPAVFSVLTSHAARQLEALEQQTEEGTLERIGILEAYGIYDEALSNAEQFVAFNEKPILANEILVRLLKRLSH